MKKYFILFTVLLLWLTSCETTLPVEIPEGEEWGITLNAVATPDTTFHAYVTHCYPNSEAPEYTYPTGWYEDIYFERDPYKHFYAGYVLDSLWLNGVNHQIRKESVLADAKVELTVNGETTYPMSYNADRLCFQSNYTPSVDDRLEVRISHESGEQTVARTEVPRPQKLEILEVRKETKKEEEWMEWGRYKGHIKMKVRLHDPVGEKNYYLLKVRGILFHYDSFYYVHDTYRSSSPIFRDERLTSTWGAWDAYFSDVFDDRLINGETYEFEIETYAYGWEYLEWMPTYEVSLQSITEDYYHYLKSLQLYRISTLGTYSEGVYIHSNNEGGWGMLGSMSGEVYRVKIPDEWWNVDSGIINFTPSP